MIGDDLDSNNDGMIDDLLSFSGIMDAVGVIEDVGDPDYASDFGGTYLNPNGNSFDPILVFRNGSNAEWYYTETTEVFDESGSLFTQPFTADPFTPTFGSFNPSVVIPEPGSFALLSVCGLGMIARRRKRC